MATSNYQGGPASQHEGHQHRLRGSKTYDATRPPPHHIQTVHRLSQPNVLQHNGFSGGTQNIGISNPSFPHSGRLREGEVSHMEQKFDEMLQDGEHYNADEARPSNNPTPMVTEVHALMPSKTQMPDHYSYYGNISSHEAEQILRENSRRNAYLTRFSSNYQSYMLAVIFVHNNQDRVCHFNLIIDTQESKYSLEGTELVFDSLDSLLQHYETNRLMPEINNIGTACQPEPASSRRYNYAHTDQAYKEMLSKVVQNEIQKAFQQSGRTDPQPQPQAQPQAPPQIQPAQSQPNAELETMKEMLKQQQKIIEHLEAKSNPRCTIL